MLAQTQALERQEANDPTLKRLNENVQKSLQEEQSTVNDAQRKMEGMDKAADIQPWDSEKEAAKYSTDTLKAFGSAGSMFAILASAFTHRPMVNALNGAAAAMNAIRQGDEQAYNNAYAAWKDNTDLAIKRHQMQMEDIKNILELAKTKPEVAMTEAARYSAQYEDLIQKKHMDVGDWAKTAEIAVARENAALRLMEIQPELQKFNIQKQGYQEDAASAKTPQEKADAYQKWFGPGRLTLANEQAQLVDQLMAGGMSAEDALKQVLTASKPMTPEQTVQNEDKAQKAFEADQRTKNYRQTEHAVKVADQVLSHPETAGAGDYAVMFSYLKGLNPGAVVRMQEITAAEDSASLADWFKRTYAHAKSGNMLAQSQLERMKEVLDDEARITRDAFQKHRDDVVKTAKGRGLDPANIVGSDDAKPTPEGNAPPGAKFTAVGTGGKIYYYDGEGNRLQ